MPSTIYWPSFFFWWTLNAAAEVGRFQRLYTYTKGGVRRCDGVLRRRMKTWHSTAEDITTATWECRIHIPNAPERTEENIIRHVSTPRSIDLNTAIYLARFSGCRKKILISGQSSLISIRVRCTISDEISDTNCSSRRPSSLIDILTSPTESSL